jgi:hypothetical protein
MADETKYLKFNGKLLKFNNSLLTRTEVSAPAYPTDGLIMELKMEQNANDSYGSLAGTGVNQTYTASGKVGYAALYEGDATEHITCHNDIMNYIYGNTKIFSFSLWFYPTSLAQDESWILGNWPAGASEVFGVVANSNGSILTLREGSGGTYLGTANAGEVSANNWYYLAAGYNSGIVWSKIYNAAGLVRSAASSDTDRPGTNTTPYYVGRRGTASSKPFSGRIDQVRLYNKTLSDAEILQLYNSGSGI